MRDRRALLLVGVYTAAWLVLGIGITVVVALAIVLVTIGLEGLPELDPNDPLAVQHAVEGFTAGGPAVVGSLLVQFPVMFGIAEVVRWVGEKDVLRIPRRAWREAYAWRPVAWPVMTVGLLLGLTAGWFPGWIAEQLRTALPWLDLGAFQAISSLLREGHPISRGIAVFCIVVMAPLVEELVFRGFMWDALDRAIGPWGALVGTSLLFAGYHMDPIQGSALIFTAFVLGWVRLSSGSVLPGIGLHAVNNTLGVVGTLVAAEDETAGVPGLAVVVALLLTLGMCAALPRLAGQAEAPA